MKDDGICGRHLFYITRQFFLLFSVKEWTNRAMLSGAQVQGTTSTSVASALISQSYEACKWQCLYIIPHTDRHTHTHTYTHTDSHSHTVRITHHIWACHRKMEHSTDTHTQSGQHTMVGEQLLQHFVCSSDHYWHVFGDLAQQWIHFTDLQHSTAFMSHPWCNVLAPWPYNRKYKLKTQAYTEKREDRAG